MKKISIFVLAICLPLVLSGCGKKEAQNQNTGDQNTQSNQAQQQNSEKKEDKNIFASIGDAMSKSIPLKCTYTDESGNGATMYFKGKIIRADAVKAQPTDPLVSEIIKDNKIYIWSDNSDKGMLIDLSLIKPGDDTFKMDETPIYSSDDIVKKIDEQKQNCVKADIDDSIFEIPANIEFPSLGSM
jgi:hypothetical protein